MFDGKKTKYKWCLSNQNQPSCWDVSPLAFLATTSTFAFAASRARATQRITYRSHRKSWRQNAQTYFSHFMRCIYHIQKTTWCLWPVNKLSQWLNCDGSNFPTTTYNSLIFFWSYNLLETFWSTWSWKEKQSGHLPATHTLKTIQKPQLAWNKNSFWVFVSVFFTKKAVKVKGDISPHNPHKPGVTTSAHLIPMLLHWQEKWDRCWRFGCFVVGCLFHPMAMQFIWVFTLKN